MGACGFGFLEVGSKNWFHSGVIIRFRVVVVVGCRWNGEQACKPARR